MRYTETISIPWHTFADEKPCPDKDIVVKLYGANTFFAPKDIIHAEDVPQALMKCNKYDEWAYADEIKSVHSDGRILPEADVLTRDKVASFAIISVSCYLFDYEERYEKVTAEVVMKDGTRIPFDVPVFTDIRTICHPHTLFYNGNRYTIDIMPNKNDPAHKEKYRGVIHRCNGPEHPFPVYGNILTFY